MKTKLHYLFSNLNHLFRNPGRVSCLAVMSIAILSVGLYAAVEYESKIVAWQHNGPAPEFTSNPSYGKKSIVGGRANVAIGDYHRVNNGNTYGASLGIGSAQVLTSSSCSLAVGGTNYISNNYWSFAAGYGLIVPSQSGSGAGYFGGRMPACVVGSYNDLTSHGGEDFLFSIGNGDSSAAPSNALTVYKDGSVVIHHPSEEIPMFGE